MTQNERQDEARQADIGRLHAHELPELLELMRVFYEHERFTFAEEASERMLRHLLSHPETGVAYLVRDGVQALGYMVLTHCYSLEFNGPFVLLDEIFLLPTAQNRGLGKRLLDVAAAYCGENGFAYLRLEVQKRNVRAIGVYRAYGFRTEDRYMLSFLVPPEA